MLLVQVSDNKVVIKFVNPQQKQALTQKKKGRKKGTIFQKDRQGKSLKSALARNNPFFE